MGARRRLLAACVLAAVCLAACSKPEPPPPDPEPGVPIPTPTLPDIVLATQRSDLVVAAEVVSVETGTRRTGGPCNEQEVTYAVATTFRGDAGAGRVAVAHPICVGRAFVDYKRVALSSEHVRPGARFLLFLRRAGAGYAPADDRFGMLEDTEAMRAEVKKAVAQLSRATGPGRRDPFNR